MSVYKGENVIAGGSVDTYFVRKPAWSQAESITIAQLNAGYTIPADGMLVGYVYTTQQGTPTKIMVNGVAIAIVYGASSDVSAGNFQTQVNQGDSVTVERSVTAANVAVSFVPFEDSTIAEPEVVTPEYIRNQNILSDYETFNITTVNQTAQFDGIASISNHGDNTRDTFIYDNDELVLTQNYTTVSSATLSDGQTLVLKKGDTYRYSGAGKNINKSKVRWYKLRDYRGR